MENAENLIALLVAAPLLGAAVLLCGGRRLDKAGHWIGTLLAAASFVIGLVLFADMAGPQWTGVGAVRDISLTPGRMS